MAGFDLKTWLEWMSPEDRIYTGFGDASVMPDAALYGIVLVPSYVVSELELALEKVKVKFGVSPKAAIHCREIFNSCARSKGVWAHLTDERAIFLLRDCFLAARSFDVRYFVAFSPKGYFPQTLRLLGKNGHADIMHAIDKNWITLNLFQGLAKYFDPAEVLPVPNYGISPRANNEPYWQIIVKRNYRGAVVDQLYVDREQAKIRWFSKSFQWVTVAKDIVIEKPTGRSFLPIISPDYGDSAFNSIHSSFCRKPGFTVIMRCDLNKFFAEQIYMKQHLLH